MIVAILQQTNKICASESFFGFSGRFDNWLLDFSKSMRSRFSLAYL